MIFVSVLMRDNGLNTFLIIFFIKFWYQDFADLMKRVVKYYFLLFSGGICVLIPFMVLDSIHK